VEDDSVGEFGDGTASLAAQNRALQADLADKNRYIATLEKRLLQARRASSSRTSVGFSAPSKSIMVGEDHSVAAALKEKDVEIAELRARLDDKDRMLAALRSAARSRDNADASLENHSLLSPPLPPPSTAGDPVKETQTTTTTIPTPSLMIRRRTKSVDEMNKMLEEMIQDRVETGHIIRSPEGSVCLPEEQTMESLTQPPHNLEPLRQSPVRMESPGLPAAEAA